MGEIVAEMRLGNLSGKKSPANRAFFRLNKFSLDSDYLSKS